MANIIPIVTSERSGWTSDLFSYHLKRRQIFLTDRIDITLAESVIAQIMYLDNQSNDVIEIIVQSGGGEVNAGNSIIDHMRMARSPIHCIGTGSVASMASVILSSGDYRYATERCEIMIHQIKGGNWGQATDVEIHAERMMNMKRDLTKTLARNSKLSYDEMFDMLERDCFLTPEQALDIGLIDRII